MIKDVKKHYEAIFASEEYARAFHPGADDPKPRKRRAMVPDNVAPSTLLRLAVVARIAFPDNSVSSGALRREGIAGRLKVYRIAGKDYSTLNDIEDMKCRVQVKVQDLPSSKPEAATPSGTSATGSGPSALDALKATAQQLRKNLQPTSPASTIPAPASAMVIPMRSK